MSNQPNANLKLCLFLPQLFSTFTQKDLQFRATPYQYPMFDPNSVTVKNGNFMGLPFDEESADLLILPIPWDVTTSYREGTCTAPQNILQASYQLDFSNPYFGNSYQKGIFLKPVEESIHALNNKTRKKAIEHIDFLEGGGREEEGGQRLMEINAACENLRTFVFNQTLELLERGKFVAILGGEHSVPLGYIQALAQKHEDFGILTIDAHMDLRQVYEGFRYSHASIFRHCLGLPQVSRLTQVGIRDWCEEEEELVGASGDRVHVFFDHQINEAGFQGRSFLQVCQEIVDRLPQKVYISFDIDGLDPKLCPHTGTPVPGGLDFPEAMYLIDRVFRSGRKVIGFDLCEVGGMGNDWDGNVGARVLYYLCGMSLGQGSS